MFEPEPERPLVALLEEIWREWEAAAVSTDHPWRFPVWGTTAESGCRLRIVILRDVDRERRTLLGHTDARSPKVAQLARDPRVGLLFYEPQARIQVTVTGTCQVVRSGPVWESQWAATTPASRRNYLGALPPGTPLPNGAAASAAEPLPAECAAFAVLEVHVSEIDWLQLGPTGNLRAGFWWRDLAWAGTWRMP